MNNHHALLHYVQKITQRLHAHYNDAHLAENYAWWTLEAITKKTRSQLLSETKFVLLPEQKELVEQWLTALIEQQMPIQYLIGWVPFLELTITVKSPVLIPRPETEEWCTRLIAQLQPYAHRSLRILDLCSGSGCIGLALAHALPNAHIVAVDISCHALELARHNAQIHKIHNITFMYSDLFENLGALQFDLIVSNPPYISEDEFKHLDVSVTAWEDTDALVAENNGYALIEKIIFQASTFLCHTTIQEFAIPHLIIEHGHMQRDYLVDLMRNAGYTHVQAYTDFANKNRVVTGRLPHVVTTEDQR